MKRKRMWDNYRVIGEVMKTGSLKIVVAIGARDGVKYVYMREFYLKKSTDEWKPSIHGMSIPLAVPIEKGTKIITPMREYRAVLTQAVEALRDFPIEDAEHAIYVEVKDDK